MYCRMLETLWQKVLGSNDRVLLSVYVSPPSSSLHVNFGYRADRRLCSAISIRVSIRVSIDKNSVF